MAEEVLEIPKGDNRTIQGTVEDADGDAVDITGATVVFSVKAEKTSTEYIFQRSTAVGGEGALTDPENGVFEIYIVPANTEDVDEGKYWYDIEIKLAGKYYTPIINRIFIREDITKH